MKIYDNYFDVCRHIERDDPETFTWKGIESTGLAEVMEEAEKHGYSYKLNCYDEVIEFFTLPGGDKVEHLVREMIFQKKLTPKEYEKTLSDIKTEIEEKADSISNSLYRDGLLYALYIINKNTEEGK